MLKKVCLANKASQFREKRLVNDFSKVPKEKAKPCSGVAFF